MPRPAVRPRSLLSHVHAQVVEIFGREMFLYDCDNFTREYYALQLNMEQPAAMDGRCVSSGRHEGGGG